MIHLGSSIKMTEIKSGSVQLLFESPPYEKMQKCCSDEKCLTNYQGKEFIEEFKRFLPERLRVVSDGGSYVLNFQAQVIDGFTSPSEYLLPQAVVESGFYLIQTHHWVKTNSMPFAPEKRLKNSHEYLWHFSKSKNYFFNKDDIREPHLWLDKDPNKNKYHPEGKDPGNVIILSKSQDQKEFNHSAKMKEGIATRFIKLLSNPGDLVLDGFCGSGQTGFETLALGRSFVGYEIHENNINLARERLGENKITEAEVMNKIWLNANETAQYTGLAVATVRSKTSRGEIPVHRIGRIPRYHREELDLWIRKGGRMEGFNSAIPSNIQQTSA